MKTHIITLLIVLGCVLVTPCIAQEADFPQIGLSYVIEFVTTREAPPNIALNSGTVVKVVNRARGGWFQVEYSRFVRNAEGQKQVHSIEKVWLNFDLVLSAKEVDDK